MDERRMMVGDATENLLTVYKAGMAVLDLLGGYDQGGRFAYSQELATFVFFAMLDALTEYEEALGSQVD